MFLYILGFFTQLSEIKSFPVDMRNESSLICDVAAGFIYVDAYHRGWNCNSSIPMFRICNESLSAWDGVYCFSNSIIGINLNGFGLSGTISESISYISKLQYLIFDNNFLYSSIPQTIGLLQNMNKLSLSNNYITGAIPSSIGALTNLVYLNMANNGLSGNIPLTIQFLIKVYHLQFQNNKLTGTIPSVIGNLTSMRYLMLYNNLFSGTIPTTIGYLTRINYLELQDNFLTGTIPTCIGNFNKLILLILSSNMLTGSIPTSIGVLSNLYYVMLDSNELTGSIPTSICLLPGLFLFYLYENKISGTIPTSIGLLANVRSLQLFKNELTGTIPTSIGLLTKLQFLYVYSNKLTGKIPTSIGNMKSLYSFNPSINKLSGSLPSSFGLLTSSPLTLYLNNNKFIGTIPNSLNNSKYFQSLDFSYNSLSGTLPLWLCKKEIITSILLNNNFLNGTISSAIGRATKLIRLDLTSNYFTGTIPTAVGFLSSMTLLGLADNQLTNTIPIEIINMTMLQKLKLHTNSLTGTIPTSLVAMSGLRYLFLYSNKLTGNIPNQLVWNNGLQYLDLYDNNLTGTIPDAIGNCTSMIRLVMSSNKLRGSLPTSIIDMVHLEYLYVSENKLTGRLPSSMKAWTQLKVLEVNNNAFTGTVPTALSFLSSLEQLYLRGNHLEGPVTDILNVTRQLYIRNIDISDNYVTGTIPVAWFNSSILEIFAATSNCLMLPDLVNICLARKLVVLSMDGIQTTDKCQNFFFSFSKSKTYALVHNFKNSVPACLYALPKLSVLHLSGNALTGSIPSSVVLGASLTDLTLSYNRLHGTIPEVIQSRNWTTLDLSYNSFSGTLSTSIPTVTDGDSRLYVNINRLSGDIPPTLLLRADVTVVDGNIFQCNFDTNKLPSGDSDSSSYNCGSDAFYLSLYVFLGSSLLTTVAVGLLVHLKFLASNPLKMSIPAKGVALTRLMFRMTALTFAMTIFILCVMMPVFGALSRYYGTHSYEYAWSVSAGFLSGHNAKVIMLVVWSTMLLYFTVVYKILFKSSRSDSTTGVISPEAVTDTYIDANPRGLLWDNIVLSMLFLINVVVVFAANAAYIIATLQSNVYTVVFTQFLLGLFKVIWRYGYIEYIGTFRDWITGHTHRNKHELLFLTLMLVLNNVVLPVFSETVIDSNCIYHIFVSPDPVMSSYDYQVCLSESDPSSNDVCFSYDTQIVDISFTPPFIYRYQCCATIIRNYVSVYTYMFVFTALQIPMSAVVVWMRSRFPKDSLQHRLLGLGVHQLHDDPPYLNYPLYVAGLISSVAILVTFGAAFPPLAAIIFIAMAMDAVYVTNALPAEAAPVPINDLGIAMHLAPFSAIYFSFFLFDTSDYREGAWSSLWAPMTVILIPLLYYLVHYLLQVSTIKQSGTSRENSFKADEVERGKEGESTKYFDTITRQASDVKGDTTTNAHEKPTANYDDVVFFEDCDWDNCTGGL